MPRLLNLVVPGSEDFFQRLTRPVPDGSGTDVG